ncbi:hypothetical protein MGYG_01470 [Nannizzia gypsea CBS 118893]|uniref:Uncharacterized protein n=1 Tax=Arthroderma gypseum (strain ATCC MYA-4604 / CBS 118893) TaxID=535722 RepID=E5R153_ARTGP|nr:hypothetical protein MGYG_01470 [Nannizzia gypsea CBS 118893]EFQ98442.1 hypothetical protein MGYG_01470 [Nannizzia gypsea CBS 118893]
MEAVDLVIVGAGPYGLSAAKTYLEVYPSANVVVLEAESSIGGVWAKHRLYKDLCTNNVFGSYEFPDLAMDTETFGAEKGKPIPGPTMHAYMNAYAKKFSLTERIRLRTRLVSAEHREDPSSWLLTVDENSDGMEATVGGTSTILTRKLIMATGMTSRPHLPKFKGQDTFEAPIFHSKNMPKYESDLLHPDKTVVVYGGGKTAWDMAYICAAAGVSVNFVIRENGRGPAWMTRARITPLKILLEYLLLTRCTTWMSPCIWATTGPTKFLHETWLGRKVINGFWALVKNDVVTANKYNKHPEVKKLTPWLDPYWVATSLSILNYPSDFFDFVRSGQIKVHIADIDSLSSRTVHLSNGTSLGADAVICGTGWEARSPVTFLPDGIEEQLGVPWAPEPLDKSLLEAADKHILRQFPQLKTSAKVNERYKHYSADAETQSSHPYRLIRFMAPPRLKDRSIVFLGTATNIDTPITAQVQALWATAYLSDRLEVRPLVARPAEPKPTAEEDKTDWEVALHSQFSIWRYREGMRMRNPDFVFESIPYIDLMLQDLGLQHRRKKGFFRENFTVYRPREYQGMIDEWKAKNMTSSTSTE